MFIMISEIGQSLRRVAVRVSRYDAVALFSISLFATLSVPASARTLGECVRENMIESFLAHRGLSADMDRQVYGSYYSRKATRIMIDSARPSEHGFKHTGARTLEEARRKSLQVAQYLPSVNHITLERSVLHSRAGEWFLHGNATLYKFERFADPIGYDQGQETRWIRVEVSSGVFHGHPVSITTVRKYLKDAEP